MTRGRRYGTRVVMVGYDTGSTAGTAPDRCATKSPTIRKGNARKTMKTTFGFKKAEATDEATQSVTGEPQAYVFLGRDKYRADEQENGAQGWRKLFLTLADMASEGTAGKVTQNTFGLEILYTGLLEILEQAKADLGADFDATFDATWNKLEALEVAKNERKAARQKADAEANAAREAATEPTPEPVAPAATPATRRR